jgi:ElaB/YqjD/DUF883 family membrane-anchored ribosome-binding protein
MMTKLTDTAREKMADAREKAGEKLKSAREKASTVAATAKDKASEASAVAREKSAKAVAATKQTARTAADKTAKGVEQNPLAAVLGGLAIGAIAAALLPRTAREDKAVGAVGNKVRETAKNAAKMAKDTGKEQLDALGVNADAAKDQLRDLVGKISQAVTSAAEAAGESVKKR